MVRGLVFLMVRDFLHLPLNFYVYLPPSAFFFSFERLLSWHILSRYRVTTSSLFSHDYFLFGSIFLLDILYGARLNFFLFEGARLILMAVLYFSKFLSK